MLEVKIEISWQALEVGWYWEVNVDGKCVYGRERDYLNAESRVAEALRRLGVWL